MPAGNTYEPIATTTLTATNSTVTFSSIPSIYTDLVLIVNSLGTGAYYSIQVNGDTGTNYSRTRINGNGSTVTSARNASASDIPVDDLSSTVREISILNFQNYSNSTIFCFVFKDLESVTPDKRTFNKYQYFGLKIVLKIYLIRK